MDIKIALKNGNICCPVCQHGLQDKNTNGESGTLQCLSCDRKYPVIEGIPAFALQNGQRPGIKHDIKEFWGELYQTIYAENDQTLSRNEFTQKMYALKVLFSHRRHIAVNEMPIYKLNGKKVLEVGSGAGAHSAFFASEGANMFSIDITLERVIATKKKLELIDGAKNIILQADAESLPFPDNHFDIVYSNGVIHHTPQTDKAVCEIHRVLKPGGQAIIMLYARESFMFWINLFLVKGILMGGRFKSKKWLGKATEWMSNKRQYVYNPETKVYSSYDIKKLFQNYEHVKIRKNSFLVDQIPVVGKYFSKFLGKFTGYNESGILLYGHPWRNETLIELWLGQYIGFGFNILAIK